MLLQICRNISLVAFSEGNSVRGTICVLCNNIAKIKWKSIDTFIVYVPTK